MRKIYKIFVAVLFAIGLSGSLLAQTKFFTKLGENKTVETTGQRLIIPNKFYTTTLDVPGLRNYLWSLPSEQSLGNNRSQVPILELPMPDGSSAKFRVWESSVQAPELQAKFPEIRTFLGQGIDDPYATIRLDFNPYFGFHAQILSSENGNIYIDPYARGNINNYISYYTYNNKRNAPFICGVQDEDPPVAAKENAGPCRGTQLYTYRLAVACTGEYAQAVGGTTPAALHAAIVTTVNRVDGVYENELSIRLVLIANNDVIEFMNPSTDPFSGNDNANTLINESQAIIAGNIGSSNFDIGHTFSTGGGGLAGVGVVCNNSNKARGITGSTNPVGDNYDIDYVAHEMGHQFGGSHTFNSITSSCGGGNRSAGQAYEVGSGTTIMAYAGICGSDNIQPHSDPFFHTISFDQISSYVETGGAACRVVTNTGNTLPVITAMNNNGVSIPLNTPFTLTGSATDADGDALTYCWEEWDLGDAGSWNSGGSSTTAPLFKSKPPKPTGSRNFPDMAVILAGYPSNPAATMGGLKGETLPKVARTMKFRLTVRDNRAGGGGVVTGGDGCQTGFTDIFQVNVVGDNPNNPFQVTSQNTTGIVYSGGSAQTVTWNIAGTDVAPISTANVRISLSTDGGLTFPTEIIASTPNDGSQSVTIPNVATTTARIKVEAVGNIFFDINNANFTITSSAGFTFNNPSAATVSCPAPASMNLSLGTTSVGGFSTPINLTATAGVPSGTNVTFGTNPVAPGSSSVVTLNNTNTLAVGSYTITITGTAGSTVQTRDVTFTIQPGTAPTINTQPQPQTVCASSNASFSVAATGALSYQWQLSTNGGGSYTNVSGATSSSYTVTSPAASQNGHLYRVIVNGQCGAVTSSAATLNVNTAPSISVQPANQTLCLGSNATFSVTASGTGISYQWQENTGSGFTNISGATSSSYTKTGITTAMNGYQYKVIVSGTCTPAANSAAATLTVISPVTVSAQPEDITICETGNVSFTAAGSGSGVLYQWQLSTNGGGSYSNITGATAATLNVNNVEAAMNNNRYRVLVSNATCTTPATSNAAILTVNARPTVTLSASPLTELYPGQTTTISAAINPNPVGFNISWYRNDAEIPGVTGTSYTVDVTGIGDYKVKIVNATTGCNNESAVLPITAEESQRLFVFPSPNDGQFTVSYYNSGGTNTKQTINVYDAHGALVYSAILPVTGQYTLHPVNLKGKAAGVYIVVVGDANGKKLAQEKVLIY